MSMNFIEESRNRVNIAEELDDASNRNDKHLFIKNGLKFLVAESSKSEDSLSNGTQSLALTDEFINSVNLREFDLPKIGSVIAKKILENPSVAVASLRNLLSGIGTDDNLEFYRKCGMASHDPKFQILYNSNNLVIEYSLNRNSRWQPATGSDLHLTRYFPEGPPSRGTLVRVLVPRAGITRLTIIEEIKDVASVLHENLDMSKSGIDMSKAVAKTAIFPAIKTDDYIWYKPASYDERSAYFSNLERWRKNGGESGWDNYDIHDQSYASEPQEPKDKPCHERFLNECGLKLGGTFATLISLATALIKGRDFFLRLFPIEDDKIEIRTEKEKSISLSISENKLAIQGKRSEKKLGWISIKQKKGL